MADGSPNGITLNLATGVPTNAAATCDPTGTSSNVLQIGTEGGFLPKPVLVPTNLPFNAPAPFPIGDPRNDYFPGFNATNNTKGNPVNALTPAGFGPNSRVLMRFSVGTTVTAPADLPLLIIATDLTAGIDAPLVPFGSSAPPAGVAIRQLTLNETFDVFGRLFQMLGTAVSPGSPSAGFGRPYESAATEVVRAGTTEVWEIFNTTADVHPMHFHLVNVQVINRQPFQVSSLGNTKGGVNFTGPVTPAEPNETGWKETVMMFPGTVTRIIMQFNVPSIVTAGGVVVPTPPSPRTGSNEYVWHCHILEHEEHDMMRPLVVT